MYSVHKAKRGNHEEMSLGKDWAHGFSLTEVMVAIVLLTFGLLALAKMQTQAVASNSFGNQLTQATFLAQDKLEELRLLNECYLAVLAKPQISWTMEDQNVVSNYNSQLGDTENNWVDTDSDDNGDDFDWALTPDHDNSHGPGGVANPIDVSGAAASAGGYTRTWNIVDNVPVTKAKTVHVRVTWGKGRQVNLHTVLSQ